MDLAEHGILINTVHPTFIEIDMTGSFMENEEIMKEVINWITFGHVWQREDVAGKVLCLASNDSQNGYRIFH